MDKLKSFFSSGSRVEQFESSVSSSARALKKDAERQRYKADYVAINIGRAMEGRTPGPTLEQVRAYEERVAERARRRQVISEFKSESKSSG